MLTNNHEQERKTIFAAAMNARSSAEISVVQFICRVLVRVAGLSTVERIKRFSLPTMKGDVNLSGQHSSSQTCPQLRRSRVFSPGPLTASCSILPLARHS